MKKIAPKAFSRIRRLALVLLACGTAETAALAQTAVQSPGLLKSGSLISFPGLPDNFTAVLQKMGGRMMSPNLAQVSLTGTTTDSAGSRPAQITIQAPGLLAYREGSSLALTFDGAQFASS